MKKLFRLASMVCALGAFGLGCSDKGASGNSGGTGGSGPTGGTEENPVGTAYVALAHPTGTDVTRFGWLGTRHEIMSRTAKLALNMVRLRLMKA